MRPLESQALSTHDIDAGFDTGHEKPRISPAAKQSTPLLAAKALVHHLVCISADRIKQSMHTDFACVRTGQAKQAITTRMEVAVPTSE